MKEGLRVIALILSLLLLAACAAVEKPKAPSTSEAGVDDPKDVLIAAKGEKTPFKLVIPFDAEQREREQMLRVKDAFKEVLGVNLSYVDDYSASDETPFEIIIGAQKRDICREETQKLGKDSYSIQVQQTENGCKIVLSYRGYYALIRVIDRFLALTMHAEGNVTAYIKATHFETAGCGETDLMITSTLPLRDPCILLADGVYYCYGTGYNAFKNTSGSLAGPWEHLGSFVQMPTDAVGDYWAPEVHEYNGSYYMFATYRSEKSGLRGCSVFRSSRPDGGFTEISQGHITPAGMEAIDATLFVDEDGTPWMIFVREWTKCEDGIGRMMAAKLSNDLTEMISEPVELFRADDAPWATSGVTDGCWLRRLKTGELIMIWSNFAKDGYSIGIARSENGKVDGTWVQDKNRLFGKDILSEYDGGHGMIFEDKDGQLYLSLHSPNAKVGDRPETVTFVAIREEIGTLVFDPKDTP